jgi:dihydropteroate synthase
MTRTLIAALIALTASSGLAAAQLSAKANIDSHVVIIDATGEHTRPNLFDQIRDTAPRTIFDQIRDSAPRTPFDQIATMAP